MGLNQGTTPHLDESSTPPDNIPLILLIAILIIINEPHLNVDQRVLVREELDSSCPMESDGESGSRGDCVGVGGVSKIIPSTNDNPTTNSCTDNQYAISRKRLISPSTESGSANKRQCVENLNLNVENFLSSSSMENHRESGSRDHAAVTGLSQTSESFSTHSPTGTTATASSSSSMESQRESGSRDHAAVREVSQTSESFSTHSSTGTTATASRSLLYITQLRFYQLNPHHLPVVNQDIQVVEAVDRYEDNDPEVDTPAAAALEAEQQQSHHDVAPLRENNENELLQLDLREPIQLSSSEPMQLDSPEPEIYNFDNSDEYVNVCPHSK